MSKIKLLPSRGVFPLNEFARRSAEKYPERVAMRIFRNNKYEEITYQDFSKKVEEVGKSLISMGVNPDDRVAILSENRPEWGIAYLGILSAGGIVIPLDVLQEPSSILNFLKNSKSKYLFVSKKHYETVLDFKEEAKDLKGIIAFDGEKDEEGFVIPYSDLLKGAMVTGLPEINLNKVAVIIYTSGTTGMPKAVPLTHNNIATDVEAVCRVIPVNEKDNFLSVLPIHHTFECTAGFLAPIYVGASITYARSLKSKELLEDISKTKVTIMLGVPLLFEKMATGIKKGLSEKPALIRGLVKVLQMISKAGNIFSVNFYETLLKPIRKKAGLGSIKFFVSGGGPLAFWVADFFEKLGFGFLQGYGLTETSPITNVNPPDKPKNKSVGLPIPGCEIKIDKPNDEGVGEILIKGPMVFSGYLNAPDLNKEVFTQDGWFRTGDLGRLDEDGYLYICGRIKNVIVTRAGKNVYPEEIEEVLGASPYILESLVIGKKVEGGEEIFAIIVPDMEQIKQDKSEEFASNEADVRKLIDSEVRRINQMLSEFKRIRKFAIRYEEFPKTTTRKIKRYLFQFEKDMIDIV